tara:strand:+ start:3192 stop:4907 length:1716 start_codon:yes stop_codon:yes gene_type:complete
LLDTIIKNGLIVDGTGEQSFFGDIGIKNGIIYEIGKISSQAKKIYDADGYHVMPGWVDIHTHYDGQVSWDPLLTPSFWQGVTTVVMGNCGVGFAPVHKNSRDWLIGLMEGVEDIPGSALAIGMKWEWESFPEYLDAIEKKPHAIDFGCQIAHGPLRAYVMGERGSNNENANEDDIKQMSILVEDAMKKGALGFSTSRTMLHLAVDGNPVPGTFASDFELLSLARSVANSGKGLFESAPAGISGDDIIAPKKEISMMSKISQDSGIPVTFLFAQNNKAPDDWKELLLQCDIENKKGAKLFPQVFGRPTNLLFSFRGPNQFSRFPTYKKLLSLPDEKRFNTLKDPLIRKKILSENDPIDDALADMIQNAWDQTYVMGDSIDYEPLKEKTISYIAKKRNIPPNEVAYDEMLKNNCSNYLMFCGLNYTFGNLNALYDQINHPSSIIGGGDGGAHVSYICDANVPTFMLTHWTRDRSRGPKFPIEKIVKKQTSDTAKLYGFLDRGVLKKGFRADINIIDYQNLKINKPFIVNDLPGNAQRLMSKAEGYQKTFVSGELVQENGQDTGCRPGKLVRSQ